MPASSTPNFSFPEMATSVGRRIRTLRARRGVSLSALAAATGLGKGTVSELERGRRNPTLDTLFAIATVLAVPVSDLLAPATDERGRGGTARAHGQNVDAELLGRWTEAGEVVEVYRMIVGAGRRQSQPHAAGVTESITVLTGEVLVGWEGNPARLSSGQGHTFPGDRPHVYEGVAARSSTVLVMRYPAASPDGAASAETSVTDG